MIFLNPHSLFANVCVNDGISLLIKNDELAYYTPSPNPPPTHSHCCPAPHPPAPKQVALLSAMSLGRERERDRATSTWDHVRSWNVECGRNIYHTIFMLLMRRGSRGTGTARQGNGREKISHQNMMKKEERKRETDRRLEKLR